MVQIRVAGLKGNSDRGGQAEAAAVKMVGLEAETGKEETWRAQLLIP